MTKTQMYLINAVCWTCALLFLGAGGWVLNRLVPNGTLKTFGDFVLITVALALFGGVYKRPPAVDESDTPAPAKGHQHVSRDASPHE